MGSPPTPSSATSLAMSPKMTPSSLTSLSGNSCRTLPSCASPELCAKKKSWQRFLSLPLTLLYPTYPTLPPALLCSALLCPALPCPALPCPALPCPALPCPALPCPALPCPKYPMLIQYKQVIEVERELGLSGCSNTKTGNTLVRGVSGGERKRANIGVELLSEPSMLINVSVIITHF